MTALAGERLISRALSPGVLRAAKEGRARDVLVLLMTDHEDLMRTPEGAIFGLALAVRIRREARHGDDYVPSGSIPDVIRGGVRNLRAGCYTFGDILDLAAHHLVSTGEAEAIEARLRAGVTVRALLRERYGVVTGESERGDRSDLKRFRLWLADARWRIRRLRADEKRRGYRGGFSRGELRRPAG